jgi:hypothetical protein
MLNFCAFIQFLGSLYNDSIKIYLIKTIHFIFLPGTVLVKHKNLARSEPALKYFSASIYLKYLDELNSPFSCSSVRS